MKKTLFLIGMFLILPVTFLGCGGGGSSSIGTGTTTSATITGSVVDGYVRGAHVFVYDDLSMENRIGEGTTDLDGHFKISLTTDRVPSMLTMMSEAGTVADTGLTAPTMRFAGAPASGPYNITPITDHLYEETFNMGGDLQGAMNRVSARMNLTLSQLYEDPEMNVDVKEEMMKLLASGAQGGTLNPGTYTGYMMVFTGDMVNVDSIANVSDLIAKHRESVIFTLSSNGVVTGQTGRGAPVKGRVRGSSIFMEVSDGSRAVVRLAGEIGLMGSVSGVATESDTSGENITRGNFLLTMLPGSGLDYQGIAGMIKDMVVGPYHLIAGDSYRADASQDLEMHWGDVTINGIQNGMMDIPAFSLSHDSSPDTIENMTVIEGRIDTDGNSHPTLLKVMEVTDSSSTMKEYIVSTIGNRRGIYLIADGITGVVESMGEAYMVRKDSLTPALDEGSSYHLEIARVHMGLLGKVRSGNLINDEVFSYRDINTPTTMMGSMMGGTYGGMMGHMGDISYSDGLSVYGGSMMGWKFDQNTNHMGDPGDMMALVQMYETGAMSGEMWMGGAIDSSTLYSDFPGLYVAYAKKMGETPRNFKGSLNYLERSIYRSGTGVSAHAYGSGKITLHDSTNSPTDVTLTYTDPKGNLVSYPLSCQMNDGITHMQGPLTDAGEYMDIFWPVGGGKASWMISNSPNGNGTVTEIGEAFLTK